MDGMRRSKTVNGTTITHIWVGGQIVADVTGNYTATCYVRGTNLLAQYEFNYGASDDYTYYLQNAHGDVTALLDAAGELTKSYVYDAFGVEQNIDDSDSNAFRYCGEYYDAETGTVYLRARYYNPVTGRFISRDTFTGKHEEPLSLNLYTYCHNNPIFNFDPSGHSIWSELADCWQTGIDMLKDGCWGNGGKIFVSYSEGVVDTMSGYGDAATEFVQNPIKTTGNALYQFANDPTKPLRDVGGFYCDLAIASYNHDWESVAYEMGGATSHTAVVGSTYIATTGIASNIPETINVPTLNYSAYALTGGSVAYGFAVSTTCVSTAGAVAVAEGTIAANIMYSQYTAPKGGGGKTDSINVNGREVTFGHGGRHLEGTGLTPEQVNSAIANNLPDLRPGEFYKGTVNINGVTIEYTSYGLTECKVNVGTYYPK